MPSTDEPRRRAQALMRIEEFQAKLDPRNVFGSVIFGKMGREALGSRVDDLLTELLRWNDYVQGETFLAGDQFTLADIAVFPLLMHFEALGYPYEDKAPALHAYMERCKLRPSVVESGWVPIFTSFAQSQDPAQVLSD